MIEPRSGEAIVTGASPEEPFDDSLSILKQTFEDVVALERWLGQAIPITRPLTGGEATAVGWAARLIDGVKGTWTGVNFTLAEDPGESALAAGGVLQVRRQLSIDVLGERYKLGDEATYINDFKVSSSEIVSDGWMYVLAPTHREAATLTRLERPDLVGGVSASQSDEQGGA